MFQSFICRIARLYQEPHHVKISQIHSSSELENEVSYSELDTPADTSLVGANCHVIAYINKICEVTPYYPMGLLHNLSL